jgi:hypothetical protein
MQGCTETVVYKAVTGTPPSFELYEFLASGLLLAGVI